MKKSIATWLFQILSLMLIIVFVGCTDNKQQGSERKELPKETIQNKGIETGFSERKHEDNKVDIDFVSIIPKIENDTFLWFYYNKIKINWEMLLRKSQLPKSAENSEGVDVGTLAYGDFGFVERYSTFAFRDVVKDTMNYYLLTFDGITKLNIDSVEAVVRYEREVPPVFFGRFIVRSPNFVAPCAFVAVTSENDLENKVRVYSALEKTLTIQINPKTHALLLNWKEQNYIGHIRQGKLQQSETAIIQMIDNTEYLLVSLTDTEGMCNHFFYLFLLKDGKLKEIAINGYGCDM